MDLCCIPCMSKNTRNGFSAVDSLFSDSLLAIHQNLRTLNGVFSNVKDISMNNNQRFLILTLILSLLMTASCGFHLRGSGGTNLGKILPSLVVDGIETETGFGLELVRVLRANDVEVIPPSKGQPPVLRLQPVEVSKEVLSVDQEVRAREFSLVSKVRFRLKGVPGVSSSERSVRVRRDLVVDPNQVLGSEQEEQRLLKEMEQELAQMLVFRLRLEKKREVDK